MAVPSVENPPVDDPTFFEKRGPDYFYDMPHHHWNYLNLGMEQEEMFTTLAPRFNVHTIHLLDADAWGRDVAFVSWQARDREEFFRLLQERRDERQKELAEILEKGLRETIGNIQSLPWHHWAYALDVKRFGSWDAVVCFFAEFSKDLRKEPVGSALAVDAAQAPSSPGPMSDASLSANEEYVDAPTSPIPATPVHQEHEDAPTPVATPSPAASITTSSAEATILSPRRTKTSTSGARGWMVK